jgi:hypothetical protein
MESKKTSSKKNKRIEEEEMSDSDDVIDTSTKKAKKLTLSGSRYKNEIKPSIDMGSDDYDDDIVMSEVDEEEEEEKEGMGEMLDGEEYYGFGEDNDDHNDNILHK